MDGPRRWRCRDSYSVTRHARFAPTREAVEMRKVMTERVGSHEAKVSCVGACVNRFHRRPNRAAPDSNSEADDLPRHALCECICVLGAL